MSIHTYTCIYIHAYSIHKNEVAATTQFDPKKMVASIRHAYILLNILTYTCIHIRTRSRNEAAATTLILNKWSRLYHNTGIAHIYMHTSLINA